MPTEGPTRVLIVDDHIGIRNGIFSLLNAEWPRMCCTFAAGTPHEALMLGRVQQPRVVVRHANLASDDGLALILPLQGLASCEIVVLTSLSDPHVAARAQRLGAHACLHKTAPTAELVACVSAAHRSRAVVAPLNEGGIVSLLHGSKHLSAQGRTNDVDSGTAA